MEDSTILSLDEDYNLEAKKAAGRDGKGELPQSFWPTYSAMANTDGGIILLGVEEKPIGEFRVYGLIDIDRVRKALWDGLNNPKVVSANLLRESDIEVVQHAKGPYLRIRVPRAMRTQKPVYVGQNPMTGTYRRNYKSNYHCNEIAVHRMLAEWTEDMHDARLLEGFTFDDLNAESLHAYRMVFNVMHPNHPWAGADDQKFLCLIGGWGCDRCLKTKGLTLAGLLMFGRWQSITNAVPHYSLDYRECSAFNEHWVDRLTTDGTWSGNLYDFCCLVIPRLSPQLSGIKDIEGTSIHIAIHEAFINCLIHAEYSKSLPILVMKQPHAFVFRNPGTLQVPLETDLKVKGGITDCRNKNLQNMFARIGLGEQAGCGLARMYASWQKQHGCLPELVEERDLEYTTLTLRTAVY